MTYVMLKKLLLTSMGQHSLEDNWKCNLLMATEKVSYNKIENFSTEQFQKITLDKILSDAFSDALVSDKELSDKQLFHDTKIYVTTRCKCIPYANLSFETYT